MSKETEVLENNEELEVIPPIEETPPKDEFVPKKAYEQTTADMHKFKAQFKKAEAELNRIKVGLR